MAASHISKKQRKQKAYDLAQQQVAEEVVSAYLSWWAGQEVQRLINKGTLLVIPADSGTGYRIGHFKTTKEGEWWRVISDRHSTELQFSSKISAVFYCLFECKNLLHKSQELLSHDTMVRQLDNDSRLYRHKYKRACELKNSFAQDLWLARSSDVNPRLTAAQEELQKLINSAKYIKIWD
jgi:hypothetical protein